ncbi:MAG: M15 family metallopeptidase, partial [Hyphococcus sp.]
PRRAARHGERALAMLAENGAGQETLAPLKTRLASAQQSRKAHDRASVLLQEALSTSWARSLETRERIRLENELGRSFILSDSIEDAAAIYASFLELAGDAGADMEAVGENTMAAYYASMVDLAADDFTEALNHAAKRPIRGGSKEAMLATASHMANLGGFYAMDNDSAYAAAGLLSTAYEARRNLLGADHRDTVQLTLLLGPLYVRMGRVEDAERLYLDSFHAQERVKGANSPDLSLYIRLLAGVYEKQNRMTEAQALNEHMRSLFRDAFGAQRYAPNRENDRRADINRPVSQQFLLEAQYAPGDLVSAAEYSIPTSKAPSIDEMKVRLAADPDADPREANMPARLAQLISLCRSESGGERLSLRSGYRSYQTQRVLHQRNGDRGTVTPPGMSEHQTGLAVDINVNGRFMRQSDRAFQCFEENAFRFGFILSYPPGNDYLPGADSYEPWHWRYVGIRTAQLYREAGPYNRPQEFLAALPCYQERAANGIFPTAGEPDICLAGPTVMTASAEPTAEDPQAPAQSGDPARILNDGSLSLQRPN